VEVTLHVLNDIFARRFAGKDPRYALLISHGLGGHSGIYNVFCEHHARRGVDVWAYDAPGHGRSTMTRGRGDFRVGEWVEACAAYAEHIKQETGLPVILLGSSLGVAASFSALYSDAVSGAVLMGSPAVPCSAGGLAPDNPLRAPELDVLDDRYGRSLRLDISRLVNFDDDYGYNGAVEQKRLDPFNTWHYDLAAWRSLFTFTPRITPDKNTKPILFAVGERDAITPLKAFETCVASISGPVRFEVLSGAGHQLMLFDTDRFSNLIEGWVPDALRSAERTSDQTLQPARMLNREVASSTKGAA
jgi:alpha-beta hydrolase superfamily lysophospholipase